MFAEGSPSCLSVFNIRPTESPPAVPLRPPALALQSFISETSLAAVTGKGVNCE